MSQEDLIMAKEDLKQAQLELAIAQEELKKQKIINKKLVGFITDRDNKLALLTMRLKRVFDAGHNDQCLFCAVKDRIAIEDDDKFNAMAVADHRVMPPIHNSLFEEFAGGGFADSVQDLIKDHSEKQQEEGDSGHREDGGGA
jgi:hypothetical protein